MTTSIEVHRDCPWCQPSKPIAALSDDEMILVNHIYEIHDLFTSKDLIKTLVMMLRKEVKEEVKYQPHYKGPPTGLKGLFLK